MNITITLTETEASDLFDVLDHTSTDIESRLPDCEDDPDAMSVWKPMYDIAQRVLALIEAETVEKMIESGELKEGCLAHPYPQGKPRTCPRCGNDRLEMTGADAHCDHEVEYNLSCLECGCQFDEVWAYSRKEITRDPMDFTPEEVEKWADKEGGAK